MHGIIHCSLSKNVIHVIWCVWSPYAQTGIKLRVSFTRDMISHFLENWFKIILNVYEVRKSRNLTRFHIETCVGYDKKIQSFSSKLRRSPASALALAARTPDLARALARPRAQPRLRACLRLRLPPCAPPPPARPPPRFPAHRLSEERGEGGWRRRSSPVLRRGVYHRKVWHRFLLSLDIIHVVVVVLVA